MRIISGKWKGRRFYLPKGVDSRPTSDMLREALFSILVNDIDENTTVLDLFSGSGSFAFEALSRGAGHAILCDENKKCIKEIQDNLERFGASKDEYTLITSDFRQALKKLDRMGTSINVCYIDPPYKSDFYIPALEQVDSIMNPDGIIILEHSRRDGMPQSIGELVKQRDRKYGNTIISIYRKAKL
jgi:16S rRNA (guanine(966)-N(2))-methyltransferase RsmD